MSRISPLNRTLRSEKSRFPYRCRRNWARSSFRNSTACRSYIRKNSSCSIPKRRRKTHALAEWRRRSRCSRLGRSLADEAATVSESENPSEQARAVVLETLRASDIYDLIDEASKNPFQRAIILRGSHAGGNMPTKLIGNTVLKRAESREVPNAERKATRSHR